MLKTSADPTLLYRQGMRFLIITNLLALFYGLTSEFGLAYILTAYLIESFLIGFITVLVLIRKTYLTKRIRAGIAVITLFVSAYFSWLSIFAILPMLLMNAFPVERMEAVADNYDTLSQLNGVTPEVFFGYAFSLCAAFLTTIIEFITIYHWPVLISLIAIYLYEFFKERPSDGRLIDEPFVNFIFRPYLRLMFLIYGPYFIGFTIFITKFEDNPEPLSWEMNAAFVIVITCIKFAFESFRFKRKFRDVAPVIMNMKSPIRYGAMEQNDRQIERKLEDTFTY